MILKQAGIAKENSLSKMKMKFVLSGFENGLKPEGDLFIGDPYVYHVLERRNLLSRFSAVEVAPFTRNNRQDLVNDSNTVDEKFEKYLPVLTARLNKIHRTNYPVIFWRKYLSLGFIRYLTAFHDTYKIINTYFDYQKFDCEILSPESYFTPLDFEENREFFLNSDLGQEQILSIYLNFRFPGKYPEYQVSQKKEIPVTRRFDRIIGILNRVKRIRYVHFVRIKNNILIKLKYAHNKDNVQVGVMGSFFSEKNYHILRDKSKDTIRNLEVARHFTNPDSITMPDRDMLSGDDGSFDEFDKFFFYTLKFCLPKICVELFDQVRNNCDAFIKRHRNLKYLVSEAWLSDSYINTLLAYLQEENVKHIYNEHNCIFHPFEGDYVKHVMSICDVYASVGWYDGKYKNLTRTASLYEYNKTGCFSKQYKILYIGVPLLVKMQHYSSAWGFSGENVPRFLRYLDTFFSSLNETTLAEISYRPYPPQNMKHILAYDKEFILKDYISRFREVTSTDESSKVQMRKAHLIIIDYISTSYLECLVMNIPFVFFWDVDSYYLKEEYNDFFAPLVNAGICHTDPVKAAALIDQVKEDPAEWWFSPKVQAGRKEFIDLNLGEPQVMIDYMLKLAAPDAG